MPSSIGKHMNSRMNYSSQQTTMLEQLSDKRLFDLARSQAYDYLDTLRARRVYPSDNALAALTLFHEAMPQTPCPADEVLRLLHTRGSPATVAQNAGRYFGFVNGGAIPVALAARWLADVWDQNAALYLMSPIVAELEKVCEKWLVELFGLPTGTAAGFVGGSATATLCGLAAGRDKILQTSGWDVEADGLFGAPRPRVILGEQAHATVWKALRLLGIGRAQVEIVPADAQGRLRADRLPALDARCLLVAQAGNVNSGSFDPLDALCRRARSAGAWVHVDGAFGLWAAACESTRFLTAGLAHADSWSVDAHKTLNAPYDVGVVLCRDRDALHGAMRIGASYIPDGEQRDGMRLTPEMSRRARAVELWATLKSLGRAGVTELLERLCRHARQFGQDLAAQGFRVLNEVVFNQVLVACDTPANTTATLARLQRAGECWCGETLWQGEPAIRLSVCSWATTDDDVQRAVAAFVDASAMAMAAST